MAVDLTTAQEEIFVGNKVVLLTDKDIMHSCRHCAMQRTQHSLCHPVLFSKEMACVSQHTSNAITLTGVRARNEPQASVLLRGILQGNPEPQDPAQGLCVQEGGILVWCHCNKRQALESFNA